MSVRCRVAGVAVGAALLLAGCTGDEPETDDPTGSPAAEATEGAEGGAAAPSDPGEAQVVGTDVVMAEQTIDTPGGQPGQVTTTLRSVEVADDVMTVRWSLRWDDGDAAADASIVLADTGIQPITTVTDQENLRVYRPYCAEGAWQGGVAELARCRASVLVSPSNGSATFPNHGTVESWAMLPAPEGRPETVAVTPMEGLPLFTDATVTYADGGEQ
ncbi:hypothetical protein GCM10023216_31020 [Isoptericola chiayiensis]|uniref:Lipoprotein n=1 Tax=Isoptericola chiayiensis TaxID=579446 RepID=A0ABP8YR97_9MICO|nr:hypothetical protein [Isoptericola chiayiensis]NOW01678.1 hypothetical protein [Isoptericola chiayiensis]